MSPPAVIVFAGPRDRYESALALQENQALEALVTEAYFSKFWAQTNLLGNYFHRFASHRHHRDIPAPKVTTSLISLYHVMAARLKPRKNCPHLHASDRNLSILAAKIAIERQVPLIAYSYYASAGFTLMENTGLKKILFQVHPHGKFLRELFTAEIEKCPEARSSIMEETEMSPLYDDNNDSFTQADGIICASSFTKLSLNKVGSTAPTDVVNYGVDIELFSPRTSFPIAKTFTVGFIGALSQRKGARYLLGALAKFPKGSIKLIIYTRATINKELIKGFESVEVEVRQGLNDKQLAEDIKQCDIMALPSIAEGFGLVILESMACGVPVLCTTSTGGLDIISHRQDGFVVQPGSIDSIYEILDWGLRNRHELFQVGQAARKKAENFTWASYRRHFFASYLELMNKK
jgi:glycosyltransferase involved in cell wall biosynthesis